MDRHHEYTTQNDLENANNLTQNYQNRTSFLIEDILYRQKNDANPDRSYENPMQIPFNRDSPKLDTYYTGKRMMPIRIDLTRIRCRYRSIGTAPN
ncbi:hypothetical protein QE152_g1472 [Popillia japonica]|uniref:Uncharacterized protein n=1 Tax=Popillia japonica TaxID=7064 RepID=A0AAW1N9M4_POPJA